jgi:hypothetical protein
MRNAVDYARAALAIVCIVLGMLLINAGSSLLGEPEVSET